MQAKEEHVCRKREFTDNLLKLRADIADQKGIVNSQKQEHAAIQHEKEQLRKELAHVNAQLQSLRKNSKELDYSIDNSKYGLIQERSNLQVAKDRLAEAREEQEFSEAPANFSSPFDYNDDNDDLHANFDDLMPRSPDHTHFNANDYDNVNFDIPTNVDSSLFGDHSDDDGFGNEDVLAQISTGAQPDTPGGIGQSPDAWGAFDVPRDPSPDPRARTRNNQNVPRIPIERLSQAPAQAPTHPRPPSSTDPTSPDYCPFGSPSPMSHTAPNHEEEEYEPFG